jgi:prepilin-type N-terminal cleavage/methylation domain-containing protein
MKRAFTLIELMVVISIIAILSTIALAGFRQAQNSARDTKKIATIVGTQAALERYFGDFGTYPASLTAAAFTSYMTLPTTGDGTLIYCGTAPCYTYTGGSTEAYTISFRKSGGGTVSYTSPD